MQKLKSALSNFLSSLDSGRTLVSDAAASRNVGILGFFVGPVVRGFIFKQGNRSNATDMAVGHEAHFDWRYRRDMPELARLYELAQNSQWKSSDIEWSRSVDPLSSDIPLLPDQFHPASRLPLWKKLSEGERAVHKHALLSWLLSQFLHGEQAAVHAACQMTQAVPWTDACLYGGTQVADETRHVEVFSKYLHEKLEKLYVIDTNLYVVIDMLMTDSRWDLKFLGMQIMVEGLALGAFSAIRHLTQEPVLKDLLTKVVRDEARHTHFGVLALQKFYREGGISEKERRYREDWAYEVALLLRNRFLAREIYDQFYGHAMRSAEWDKMVMDSPLMTLFRERMFKPIIPNLKRIGLMSDRIRKHYSKLGVLSYETGKAAPELTVDEILGDK